MGAQYGAKRAADQAHTDAAAVQTSAGMPYPSLSGYAPRWGQPLGQVDAFAAGFGNAQPAYAYR
jgi:hypothetical protein